jgi:hypothetical protein
VDYNACPESFMTAHNLIQAALQRWAVQCSLKSQSAREVVSCGCRLQLLNKPQPLLRIRERVRPGFLRLLSARFACCFPCIGRKISDRYEEITHLYLSNFVEYLSTRQIKGVRGSSLYLKV